MNNKFVIAQRWVSLGEPELGLGSVQSVDDKTVSVFFSAVETTRTYGMRSAPLKRVLFEIDDEVELVDGSIHRIKSVSTDAGVKFYVADKRSFSEEELNPRMSFTSPVDKVLLGDFSESKTFQCRYDSIMARRSYEQFPYKGFLSPRVDLLYHQFYVAQHAHHPMGAVALLSDEVGLGKTVEAALILNSLIQRGRAQSTLIVVPESLVYQWYFELKFKFNLDFRPMSLNDELGIEEDNLESAQNFIISRKKLMLEEKLQAEVEQKGWDLLIVDEAHQFDGEDLSFLQTLSKTCQHKVLLSATPKLRGERHYFSLLQILSPEHFSDFEKFKNDQTHYGELSSLILNKDYQALRDLLSTNFQALLQNNQDLVHHHVAKSGTSDFIFSNTRKNLENFGITFPKRHLHSYPIEHSEAMSDKIVFAKKMGILVELLAELKTEKILLLVHSRSMGERIEQYLRREINQKIASFNSEQSLMERDRQAAYFAEEDGASILIATEVGSEGRNFEFASHLFLFDIPKLPPVLEQRIGRLDRIGQKKSINIHLPWVQKSFEEVLFTFYKEVFKIFEQPPRGLSEFARDHSKLILETIEQPFSKDELAKTIERATVAYQKILLELESGEDVLLNLNSFDFQAAKKIIDSMQAFTQDNPLIEYLGKVFDCIGVNFENHKQDLVYYARPSETMLIPSFPGLSEEGLSFTINRDFALFNNNIEFVSWEHPLVQAAQELFLGSEVGNTNLVGHQNPRMPMLAYEMIFKLETTSLQSAVASQFLPVTPVRVFLSYQGEDFTQKFSKKQLDVETAEIHDSPILERLQKKDLKKLVTKAGEIATERSSKYVAEAKEGLRSYLEKEQAALNQESPLYDQELSSYQKLLDENLNILTNAKVKLDSLRVVVKQ